jgi:hypothetical protein
VWVGISWWEKTKKIVIFHGIFHVILMQHNEWG